MSWKCDRYQHWEKSKNFPLNLEKQKGIKTTARHLIRDVFPTVNPLGMMV